MTPDEVARLSAWIVERRSFFFPMGCMSIIGLEMLGAYLIPGHHQHALGLLLTSATAFMLVPMITVLIKANRRVARFQIRKQDSLARLTKRHETMLVKIRELEREGH